MPRRLSAVVLLAAAAVLSAAAALAIAAEAGAQSPPVGVEVRLAARSNADGSFFVGLQYRLGSGWTRIQEPTRGLVPAGSRIDAWRVSSALDLPIRQTQVRISTQRRTWTWERGPGEFVLTVNGHYRTTNCSYLLIRLSEESVALETVAPDCASLTGFAAADSVNSGARGTQPVRILARRLADGRIELGLQRRAAGEWQSLLSAAVLRSPTPSQGWTISRPVALPMPPPQISAELRPGAVVRSVGAELQVTVDEVVHRTNCGMLELKAVGATLLLDSLDERCARNIALATICADGASSACDVQRNHVYEWDRRYARSAHATALTFTQAQTIADAIFADYFPAVRVPRVVRSRDGTSYYSGRLRQIALTENGFTFGSLLHELGHALVDQAGATRSGHSGAFTAMMLELWGRYAPLVDVEAALAGAQAEALAVDSEPPARAVERRGIAGVEHIFCRGAERPAGLCEAFDGVMPELRASGEIGAGSSRGGKLWWSAYTDEGSGELRSYIALESRESRDNDSIARLLIECNTEDELEIAVWWRGDRTIPSELSHRFGLQSWQSGLWRTMYGGTWGGDGWAVHRARDSRTLLQELRWLSDSTPQFSVRYQFGGRWYSASFDLTGAFDTPVQANLVECGASKLSADPDAPVIDWGSFGDGLFWGVDEDERPLRSYVVLDTSITGFTRKARLKVQCQDGELEVDVYWDVDQDLDWTVRYQVDDAPVQTGEWISGWSTWGDGEYKWTGLEDAGDLMSSLFWAAQSGGTFTAQVHEAYNPNRRYSATWPLDDLFETPVQPNLARCGSDFTDMMES